MKDEYDFSDAEQGRFYRPLEELDIPIYLDKEVKAYFLDKLRSRKSRYSITEVVNTILKKDIEISNKLAN